VVRVPKAVAVVRRVVPWPKVVGPVHRAIEASAPDRAVRRVARWLKVVDLVRRAVPWPKVAAVVLAVADPADPADLPLAVPALVGLEVTGTNRSDTTGRRAQSLD
jgi:hypothetical protein